MKKNLITLLLNLIFITSYAQYTTTQNIDGRIGYNENVYYKDLSLVLNPFAGHYKYESNGVVFEIKLQKIEAFFNGYNYHDIIIGSYKHVVNNEVQIDVLNDINNNHQYPHDYFIYGNEIITGKNRGCEECSDEEKWIILSITDPESGGVNKLHLRKIIVNGQPTLRVFIYPVTRVRNQNDPPFLIPKYPFGISLDLMQIP